MPTPEQRIRDFYGFAFPDDFFVFQEFLTRLAPNLLGDACDMYLSFPFDVADGNPPQSHPEHPHWENRYYCDLPEFITIFTGTTDGLHWGYFFDDPGKRAPVVAHYWHSDTFEHSCGGDTIFEAVRSQVELSERDFQEMGDEPKERDYCRLRLEQLAAIREQLGAFWGSDRPETGDNYLDAYAGARDDTVAGTWDRMGIIVPKKKYRALTADLASGHRLDPQPDEVERLAAEVMELLRKGYPCGALDFGRDLWVFANKFPVCYDLLDAAYESLGREPLRRLMSEARAWRSHCDARRKK